MYVSNGHTKVFAETTSARKKNCFVNLNLQNITINAVKNWIVFNSFLFVGKVKQYVSISQQFFNRIHGYLFRFMLLHNFDLSVLRTRVKHI